MDDTIRGGAVTAIKHSKFPALPYLREKLMEVCEGSAKELPSFGREGRMMRARESWFSLRTDHFFNQEEGDV